MVGGQILVAFSEYLNFKAKLFQEATFDGLLWISFEISGRQEMVKDPTRQTWKIITMPRFHDGRSHQNEKCLAHQIQQQILKLWSRIFTNFEPSFLSTSKYKLHCNAFFYFDGKFEVGNQIENKQRTIVQKILYWLTWAVL